MSRNRRRISTLSLITIALSISCVVIFISIMPAMFGGFPKFDIKWDEIDGVFPVQAQKTNDTQNIQQQPNATPTAKPTKRSFVITAAGNIIVDKSITRTVKSSGYDFTNIFSEIRQIFTGSDLSLATLESLIEVTGKDYGTYNAPESVLSAIKAAGIDNLAMSADHVFDYGAQGVENSLQAIKSYSLNPIGVGEQPGYCVLDAGGVQVGVISTTTVLAKNKMTESEIEKLLHKGDLDNIKGDINAARAEGAQMIIVNIHWGAEGDTAPNSAIRTLAQQIADAGADIILGTHPLTAQTVEILNANTNGRQHKTLVAYSLGSLLTNDRDNSGIILKMSLSVTGDQVEFDKLEYVPTGVWYDDTDGGRVYHISPMGETIHMSSHARKRIPALWQDTIERVGQEAAQPVSAN